MEPEAPRDALARLDASARRRAGPRVRLGVGAAVVLLIAALVVAVLVSMLGQQASRTEVPPNGTTQDGYVASENDDLHEDAPSPDPRAIIFVHVLGAVRNPGLFELHDGARVIDGVAAAGGLTETADQGGANLARILGDGEQLYIPHLGEAQPGAPPAGGSIGGPSGAGAGVVGGKLNLNTAGIAELDTLPRIGPAMAQRIVDYRDANGRFSSVDDLRNVTGIGEKTFEALKDLVTV